jgi:hypothetical protein
MTNTAAAVAGASRPNRKTERSGHGIFADDWSIEGPARLCPQNCIGVAVERQFGCGSHAEVMLVNDGAEPAVLYLIL